MYLFIEPPNGMLAYGVAATVYPRWIGMAFNAAGVAALVPAIYFTYVRKPVAWRLIALLVAFYGVMTEVIPLAWAPQLYPDGSTKIIASVIVVPGVGYLLWLWWNKQKSYFGITK
jgi:hypothetical protein